MTPSDSYHEALSSHRHYDTLSNAALTLMGTVITGAPALYASVSKHDGTEAILALSAIIIAFSVNSYRRFDSYAGIALNVAAAIERGDKSVLSGNVGFAEVFKRIQDFPTMTSNRTSWTFRRIRAIGYGSAFLFLAVAAAVAAERIGSG
jgi:hypothetical protein